MDWTELFSWCRCLWPSDGNVGEEGREYTSAPRFSQTTGWLTWTSTGDAATLNACAKRDGASVVMRRAHACDIYGVSVVAVKNTSAVAISVEHQTIPFIIAGLRDAGATAININMQLARYIDRKDQPVAAPQDVKADAAAPHAAAVVVFEPANESNARAATAAAAPAAVFPAEVTKPAIGDSLRE